jgi:hypothetical protein
MPLSVSTAWVAHGKALATQRGNPAPFVFQHRHGTNTSELGHSVDCQEHVELALSQAQLADVDMDVAMAVSASLPAWVPCPGFRQSGVPCRSRHRRRLGRANLGMPSRRQPRTSLSGRRALRPNSAAMASPASAGTVLGQTWPIGASSVVILARHLATVARLRPCAGAGGWCFPSTLEAWLELSASFGLSREDCLPWRFLSLSGQSGVTTLRDQTPIMAGRLPRCGSK